jgi:hypothetical protein
VPEAVVNPKTPGTRHHDVLEGSSRKSSWRWPDDVVIAVKSEPSGAINKELPKGALSGE